MIVETGHLSHVALHEDGRVTVTRASLREGMFMHLDLSEREIAALEKVLEQRREKSSRED